ncbi:hypothetical protein EDD11_001018 [Mortierella claussenii]|nr:hypothetical protein EDD11_001018 [Mortierella claussenii]
MASPHSSLDVPFPITVDEALGEELQPHEAEIATKIANVIENTVHKSYDGKPGCARRDVHAKATAILRAELRVNDNIPPEFAKGIFVPGKTYEAVLRLSNADANPNQQDNHDDGRGFALKLLGVEGEKLLETDKTATTQDFLFIKDPIFFTNDAQTYLDLFSKMATGSVIDKITLPFTLGLRGSLIAAKLGTGKIGNPLQIPYFSAVPYQLGVGEGRLAVKYAIRPVSDQKDPIPLSPSHDYLHEAVKASVSQSPVQFKFLVQPKVNEHQNVEDSMTEWDVKEAPFYEIATLTIPTQDADSHELLVLGERLSFNPWHCLKEHRPLGSINRIRKVVYERISRVRDQINSVPREEPSLA